MYKYPLILSYTMDLHLTTVLVWILDVVTKTRVVGQWLTGVTYRSYTTNLPELTFVLFTITSDLHSLRTICLCLWAAVTHNITVSCTLMSIGTRVTPVTIRLISIVMDGRRTTNIILHLPLSIWLLVDKSKTHLTPTLLFSSYKKGYSFYEHLLPYWSLDSSLIPVKVIWSRSVLSPVPSFSGVIL